MSENLTSDVFSKTIIFPAKITFKFIGENQPTLKKNVEEFFVNEMHLNPEISTGKLSKTGKYLTLNVKVKVPDASCMNAIYSEGAKVPLVLHIL